MNDKITFFILRIFRPAIRGLVVYLAINGCVSKYSSSSVFYGCISAALIVLLELPHRFYDVSLRSSFKTIAHEIFFFFPLVSVAAFFMGLGYLLVLSNVFSARISIPPLPVIFVIGAVFPSFLLFTRSLNYTIDRLIRIVYPSLFFLKPLVVTLKFAVGFVVILVLIPMLYQDKKEREREVMQLDEKLSRQEYEETGYDVLCNALESGATFNGELVHTTEPYYNYRGQQGGTKTWPFKITFSNFDEVNQTFDGTIDWADSKPGRKISTIKGKLQDEKEVTIVETVRLRSKDWFEETEIYRFTLPMFMSATSVTLGKATISGTCLYDSGDKRPDYSIHIDLYPIDLYPN